MTNFNKNIYNFFKNKKSDLYLYLISFFESIFFPIPTDIFLIPKALINKDRAVKLAIYTTIFSVLGGVAGYMIGHFFYDEIGIQIIEKFNLIDEFNFNGDFTESQAFAFLAIRTYLKKVITLPSTTGVKKPSLGGEIFKN